MTLPVTQAVEAWHDFYVMTGGASAALVGLLFTTMALRNEATTASSIEAERDIWAAASLPLACFLNILLLSLIFLVPDQSAVGLGIPIAALSLLFSSQLLWVLMRKWVIPMRGLLRIMLPVLVCYVAEFIVAVVVVTGRTQPLWVLAVAVAGLILIAAISAWNLLRTPILVRVKRSSSIASDGSSHLASESAVSASDGVRT